MDRRGQVVMDSTLNNASGREHIGMYWEKVVKPLLKPMLFHNSPPFKYPLPNLR